mgnify:CR=1 FL=1
MKVVTSRMKDAVNKAIKGAGFNNLIPITSMIGIKLADGKLRLLTTDMTNTLCIIIDKVAGDDMDITVDADKFGKLIAKTTSEDIDLSVKDDVLFVKANGTYKIPLISDEEGLISFPDVTQDHPTMFAWDFPVLISAQQMTLISLFKEEDIKVTCDPERIIFATDTQIVEGSLMEGTEDFPADDVRAYLDEAFTSSCKVPKDLLLSVLDRLALFIEPYDKNGAYFTFGRKGINIHSKKDASTETINYVESKNFQPFVCCVDIPLFKEQLQANPDDTVKICYGNENALKIESGKVTQVIALLEDEELDNINA